jgi:hypothetical protein
MQITDLIGTYLIEGYNQNEDETIYSGTLTLSFQSDNRLAAIWQIEPDQMQYGIGFFRNEMLVINFHYVGDNQENYHGVVAYNCTAKNILQGVWSEEMGDSKFVGVEKGTKIRADFLN